MKVFYLLISLCFVLTACKTPNIDITSPTIQIKNISPNPISGWVCGTMEDNVIYAKSTETISKLGSKETLYFEIRKDGYPVNPSVYID